jgi:tetratricopeptide (TPR) repeat protein
MKAFLSHSSRDKEFVRAVAKNLGRQSCLFDEQAFDTGEEFKSSIENALDDTCIFVLFASRSALASVWVKYEIDEAWFRKLYQIITKSLVYLIDSKISHNDLPEWLKRARISRENAPKIVARDIRSHLNELLVERQTKFFIGRRTEIEELENSLFPLDGSKPPRAVFVTGLPGIGRRTFIKHASPDLLSLRKVLQIKIGEGDNTNDICMIIADHSEPYSTKKGFERIIKQIKELDDESSLDRIKDNLSRLIDAGELPMFIDDGGLLDDDGYMRQPIVRILKKIEGEDEIYLFFVSTRTPQALSDYGLPIVKVLPLKPLDNKKLVLLLADQANLKLQAPQINDLAEYIAGYPPSCYYAISQAKDYGIEAVLKDKSRLVEFQTTVFLRHLSKLNIDDNGQLILQILAAFSPLPLPAIAKAVALDLQAVTSTLIHLIDLSLVNVTDEGYYRIADPISNAVMSAYGLPSPEQHKALAESVLDYIENIESESPLLELHRVLFRSANWANDKELAAKAVHLANDLIKLTESHYHARRYRNAIKFGYAALEERKDSATARSYLIRALIQEERFQEAEKQIEELQKFSPMREVFFLKGFLERNRENFPDAIANYEKASAHGRTGVALSRELAFCYYKVDKLDKAFDHINEALSNHGDNPYIVDLWVQIACSQRDEETARKGLQRLEAIGDPLFYYHRLSRTESTFGNIPQAQKASDKAYSINSSPPFAVIAQLIYCETELQHLNRAEELLDQLDSEYSNTRQDIRLGLRCRIQIVKGQFGNALCVSEKINDKDTHFYKRIRRDALYGELNYTALKDETRAAYEREFVDLERELEGVDMAVFGPSDL